MIKNKYGIFLRYFKYDITKMEPFGSFRGFWLNLFFTIIVKNRAGILPRSLIVIYFILKVNTISNFEMTSSINICYNKNVK